MTPLTPTEIEELRIAIAEECGWHVELDDEQFHRVTDGNGNLERQLYLATLEIQSLHSLINQHQQRLDKIISALCLPSYFRGKVEKEEKTSAFDEL